MFFFFNDTATTEIYTLSLHDALPICQRLGRLAKLREHEHLLLLRRHRVDDLAQPRELAAARLVPRTFAQPMRGVVADLLEAHEIGEHQTAPLDSLREPRDGALQLVDRLLIERGLRA